MLFPREYYLLLYPKVLHSLYYHFNQTGDQKMLSECVHILV